MIPVSYKINTGGAQCNVILLAVLKKFDPEPDLCPVNIKHKKDHFDVSFTVVDSKSVPILGLATSESLNLIKPIFAMSVSEEQFLMKSFLILLEKYELSKILTILKSRII